MAPGTWAQLGVANQSAVLGVGGVTGSMIPYCNAMPWNRFNRSIEILGGDHNSPTGMRHVRYVEASNSFEVVTVSSGFVGHGYDHTEVNPYTGDLFHKKYGGVGYQPLTCFKQSFGQSTWTQLPIISANQNITFGAAWWAGTFTGGGGLGAQGGLAVFSSGMSTGASTDGFIGIYDPLSNTWPFQATSMSPNFGSGSTYNQVMAYSRVKNVAVYGGGNVAEQKVWKLSSNGVATRLTDAPSNASVGVHRGVFVDDPVTGNFLLLSKGNLFELNPDGSGTWTQQAGSRVPPSGVGIPSESGPNGFLFGTPLTDHGVVAFVRQTSSGNGAFWLYRHA